ncbi:uncharacterized protein BP5553_08468 [Venustampulla echinocandica]|uniref:DUF7918 domain-containing protein n=1 Tax=Venustampulla echinocandica TaxID=2656787 RepID=A0A370TEA9_9HELO|nr:uncharacterized protein BP5553_08468 [Venustampulla echinocandica]RDL33029.1 hypothetical protein BP5553_08468 [Venustampulla echinocandica]
MAILANIPGIQVTIHINGQPLPEYNCKDSEGNAGAEGLTICERYIESRADREFEIKMGLNPLYKFDSDALTFKVEIDKVGILSSLFRKERYIKEGNAIQVTVSGVREAVDGEPFIRKLKFTEIPKSFRNLETTEDQDRFRGVIKVNVFRAKVAGYISQVPEQRLLNPDFAGNRDTKIHAASHGGMEKATPLVVYNMCDIGQHPLATFIFFYRPKEMIQKLDLIPVDNAPKPTPLAKSEIKCESSSPLQADDKSDIDIDAFSAEKQRELYEKLAAKLACDCIELS